MDTNPPRVAIIGLGLIAQVAHLPALVALRDRVVVSHLCDVSGELASTIRLNGWPDAKITTDWAELLSADFDAVIVCTPGSHGRIAGALLDAGKHVLAEKPLCLSQAAAHVLAQKAKSAGLVLQIGYMKIHEPLVKDAAIALKSVGPLRHIRITVMHPADAPQIGHLRLHRGVATDREELAAAIAYEEAEIVAAVGAAPGSIRALYSDVLNGSVVHQLALLRGLVGTVPSSWASVLAAPIAISDTLTEPPSLQASALLENDVAVALSWNWVPGYPSYREEVEIIGADGSVNLKLSPPYAYEPPVLTVIQSTGHAQRATSTTGSHVDPFRHQLDSFLDAISGAGPVVATAADALADIASLQALTAEVASGLGVKLGGETTR